MRTITHLEIPLASLGLKQNGDPSEAARELLEVLLLEERLIWPGSEPLTRHEIQTAFKTFRAVYGTGPDVPTDPGSHALTEFARNWLRNADGVDPEETLSDEENLRYEALKHSLSILAQIPEDVREQPSSLQRVVKDRQNGVFGLMFQSDNHFTFRLRHNTPQSLKSATERIVNAIASRPASEVNPIIRKSVTHHVTDSESDLLVRFDRILMRTPKSETSQVGDVHVVGSQRALARYVGWRTPQRVLLLLSVALLVIDLLVQILLPVNNVGNLNVTEWAGGTLGRVTTAAFTAYLFAVLIEYIRLRPQFTGRTAAFIDWKTPPDSSDM